MEPDQQTRQAWTAAATAFVENFVAGLEDAPASGHDAPVSAEFLAPPPDGPGDFGDLLARFGDATQELLSRINGTRRAYLSSTRLGGRHTVRLCVLSFRTHQSHVDEVLEIVARAARP